MYQIFFTAFYYIDLVSFIFLKLILRDIDIRKKLEFHLYQNK